VVLDPDLLQTIGFNRVDSMVLSYMLSFKETMSVNIEKSCILKQPEVSMSMKRLINGYKMINSKQVRKSEMGRTTNIYTLDKNAYDLLKNMICERIQKLGDETRELSQILVIIEKHQNEAIK
jgi:predicted transcriptional regulator